MNTKDGWSENKKKVRDKEILSISKKYNFSKVFNLNYSPGKISDMNLSLIIEEFRRIFKDIKLEQNKKSKAPKQEIKESSRKGKRAKFESTRSTTEAQEEFTKQKSAKSKADQSSIEIPTVHVVRGTEALRERLQARIAHLKKARRQNDDAEQHRSLEINVEKTQKRKRRRRKRRRTRK